MPDDRRSGHKDLQVCRQVFDALSLALSELNDPILEELILESVTPAPNATRVQVLFVPSRDGVDLDAAKARLEEIAGDLRMEVAAEVTRKKAPELAFVVVPRMSTLPPLDSKPPVD